MHQTSAVAKRTTHYERLRLKNNATQGEIKAAYLKISKEVNLPLMHGKVNKSRVRMHEAPIAYRHDKVTRAPINLRCGYCYNSANVPLVMLLVLHAYGPRPITERDR